MTLQPNKVWNRSLPPRRITISKIGDQFAIKLNRVTLPLYPDFVCVPSPRRTSRFLCQSLILNAVNSTSAVNRSTIWLGQLIDLYLETKLRGHIGWIDIPLAVRMPQPNFAG